MKPFLLSLALLLAFGLAGCDETSQDDGPLPEPAALLDRFDHVSPGEGLICQGELHSCRGGGYDAEAVFNSFGPFETTGIELRTDGLLLTLDVPRRAISEIQVGSRYDAQFTYSVNGGRGGGYVYFTHVSDGRLAGVYATDTNPGGLVPAYYRVLGAFDAVPSPD